MLLVAGEHGVEPGDLDEGADLTVALDQEPELDVLGVLRVVLAGDTRQTSVI